MHTALGLYVVHLEPFFVKSMRKVMPQIRDEALREEVDRFRIGFVEGFESYTTQMALGMLASGLYEHKRSEPRFAGLFKWHLIEEIEHRNVAYDIYQHLYGSYLVRAGMCWMAQHHMFSFYADCLRIMSAADGERGGARYRTTFKHRLLFTRVEPFGKRLRTMLPGYTPHHILVPAGVATLSDQLRQPACC